MEERARRAEVTGALSANVNFAGLPTGNLIHILLVVFVPAVNEGRVPAWLHDYIASDVLHECHPFDPVNNQQNRIVGSNTHYAIRRLRERNRIVHHDVILLLRSDQAPG